MADIKTVGVVGAGQMGAGIAHVCALAGYEVAFHDVSRERIDAGLETVNKNLSRQVTRGVVSMDQMQSALARIKPSEALEMVGATDLIIEAATENEEVKKAIFKSLAPISASRRCSPPTPHPSLSPASPPPPTGRSGSSACTS